jgi:hypothetical protein
MRNHRLFRRAIRVATVMAVAAGTTLATWSPAQATPVYVRINAGLSPQVNLAIHVPSTANGAQPVLRQFTNATTGQWEIRPVGDPSFGALQFKNRYSHQCLASRYFGPVPLPGTTIPRAVSQEVCDSSDLRQRWIRTQDPILPVWRVLNMGSFLALAAPSAGTGVVENYVDEYDTRQMWQMW